MQENDLVFAFRFDREFRAPDETVLLQGIFFSPVEKPIVLQPAADREKDRGVEAPDRGIPLPDDVPPVLFEPDQLGADGGKVAVRVPFDKTAFLSYLG